MKHFRNPFLAAIVAALWLYAPIAGASLLKMFAGGGSAPTSDLPAASSVLAWYALESDGTDTSGQGRTLVDLATADHGTGKVGNCFANNDSAEWYTRSAETWMSPAGNFSVVGWIRMTDATPATNSTFFSHHATSTDNRSWNARLSTAGKVELQISTDGTLGNLTTYTSTASDADATWTYVALVFTSSTSVLIYLNGALDSTHSTSIPSAVYQSSNTALRIGTANSSSSVSFVGDMDEMALFDTAITSGNVTALYNDGAGVQFTDLP